MAWLPINSVYEYDNAPPDPGAGSPLRPLWLKQVAGIRTFKGHEVYVKCRKIGTTVDTFGELSKTYYDARP